LNSSHVKLTVELYISLSKSICILTCRITSRLFTLSQWLLPL